MPILNPDKLRRIGREVFERIGATSEEARIVADLLVASNLAGHDSHGVVRIPQYVSAVHSGQIQLGTTVEIERETDATAVVNGHWGFGHVTATEAMHIAIQKAQKSAVGIVTVHQCNHIGRLGGYPVLAAAQNNGRLNEQQRPRRRSLNGTMGRFGAHLTRKLSRCCISFGPRFSRRIGLDRGDCGRWQNAGRSGPGRARTRKIG